MVRLSLQGLWNTLTLVALIVACNVAVQESGPGASATTPWTLAQVTAPTGGWSDVNFLHGLWIALSHAALIATSMNGATWSEQPVPVGSWQTAAYGAGRFVVLSSADAVPNEMVSSNGVQWSTASGPPGTPFQAGHPVMHGQWTGITFGHRLFAAVSSIGTLATSVDGVTWSRRFWRPQDSFSSITFGDGRFIAVDAAQGDVLISLDGLHWSLIQHPLTGAVPAPPQGLHLAAVVYGNGNFVAFGSGPGSGYVATSVDGYVWALHRYAPAQGVNGAAFGCGSFVAAGQSGVALNPVIVSPTGTLWVAHAVVTATPSTWTALAYGTGRYVAVDAAGDIASSRTDANCAATVPSPPQQVSGNVHNGEVWTYMHPSKSPGTAPVLGYRVAITDGISTTYCRAPVFYEPNCIIRGLRNHKVYWVTTQAYNRFGYSAPTNPEFVIPVAVWSLDATTTLDSSSPTSVVVQVTGILANSLGFYPVTTISVHLGVRLVVCKPSPFGECVMTVDHVPSGAVALWVTYVGYGHSYRSPTHEVRSRRSRPLDERLLQSTPKLCNQNID